MMTPDPRQLAAAQSVGKHIFAQIRLNVNEYTISVTFIPDNDEAKSYLPEMMNQFVNALAMQLGSFFAIKGEIIDQK